MPRADFRCEHRMRVRWAEIDMQKVVFNGHYLTYIDTAVAEYWREIAAVSGRLSRRSLWCDLYLRKGDSRVSRLPARYDEALAVLCRVEAGSAAAAWTIAFEIWRDAPESSGGAADHRGPRPCKRRRWRPAKSTPLPEDLCARVRGYERAAPRAGVAIVERTRCCTGKISRRAKRRRSAGIRSPSRRWSSLRASSIRSLSIPTPTRGEAFVLGG